MARRGRSERTRPQRLARRRADTQGYDRGGGRRSFFRSRYAKAFYVIGLVGMIGSLVPILLIGGGDHSSSSDADGPPPVRVVDDPDLDIGAVEGKPQFDAPPELTLDTSLEYEAVLELEDGRIVRLELFDDEAPLHVNNFVFLAREGFYDGLTFHRIVADFVVQGGDPTAEGTGGAGYTLPDEVVNEAHAQLLSLAQTGVISMARGGLGASSSQFFVTLSPSGFLDEQSFTAFGRVTEGLNILEQFEARDPEVFPTPAAGPRIVSITIIEREGRDEPRVAEEQAADEPAVSTSPIGAVEGKPQFDAPPELTLDTSGEYEAVLELDGGGIVRVALFAEEAPVHVNNFLFLVGEGFYDGLTFHRIVADFVVQAGDPTATGTSGAGYTLPDEEVRDDDRDLLSLDQTGVISMARSGLGASSSQFFITLSPSGFLDAQRFTAFGRVTEGLELLQAFDVRDPAALPTPPAGPRIVSITIIER